MASGSALKDALVPLWARLGNSMGLCMQVSVEYEKVAERGDIKLRADKIVNNTRVMSIDTRPTSRRRCNV